MFELRVTLRFSAGHHLRQYHGTSETPHEHKYRVDLFVTGEKTDTEGLVADFTEIKARGQKALARFDHADLNELPEFTRINPTTENIAVVIYRALAPELDSDNVRLAAVRVWESDDACCLYRPESE
ncbi:MAG TPA: 6-carboxytetrahydropterin synthase [bacterium]|nr:6-carboxytetrahydropterin synthase [bacterium]